MPSFKAADTRSFSRRSKANEVSEIICPDSELKKSIETHFPRAHAVSKNGNGKHAPEITVEVKSGFVTLDGKVRSQQEKERLHRFVMRLSGVRALKDRLQVQPPESLADRQIALHVRQALDAHAELPHGTASVQVEDGVCTLSGHVRNAHERHVAENVASHCRGVKSVSNKLTVNNLDEISDEATVHAVESALAYCQEEDSDGVCVSCCDGKVVLRGQVPTLLDRAMAEEVARIQNGVRAVENHLQVATDDHLQPVTMAKRPKGTRIMQRSRSDLKSVE
jgi:osmotically-inducible protein OsmY